MKALVIDGHPRADSLCAALAARYVKGLQGGGAEARVVCPREMQFDLTVDPLRLEGELEPDLKKAQADIEWCEWIAVVFPTWWTGVPSLLKAFIDRTLTKGFAYRFDGKGLPEGLLRGRSGRIIHTMGAPWLANRFFSGAPQVKMLKGGTLEFCGIKPVRVTGYGGVHDHADKARLESYLADSERLGSEDAAD